MPKFIVQFVRFRSRGAEFYAFLLEAIFIYFIFFVPQFGLRGVEWVNGIT